MATTPAPAAATPAQPTDAQANADIKDSLTQVGYFAGLLSMVPGIGWIGAAVAGLNWVWQKLWPSMKALAAAKSTWAAVVTIVAVSVIGVSQLEDWAGQKFNFKSRGELNREVAALTKTNAEQFAKLAELSKPKPAVVAAACVPPELPVPAEPAKPATRIGKTPVPKVVPVKASIAPSTPACDGVFACLGAGKL